MIDPLESLFSAPRPEWRRHIYYFARTLDISMLHQLLIATSLFALALLVVPLLGRLGDLRGVARPMSSLGYFVCLGIGYIGIELTLMQRFSLFLEHPVYSMVVLLSSILFASGLGSASTAHVDPAHAPKYAVRKLVILVATIPPWPGRDDSAVAGARRSRTGPRSVARDRVATLAQRAAGFNVPKNSRSASMRKRWYATALPAQQWIHTQRTSPG